jgi:hypothetical protein
VENSDVSVAPVRPIAAPRTYTYPIRPKIETLLAAGSTAIPKLSKFIQSFPSKWSETSDNRFLGFDIDVPSHMYHPRQFIVCPVTRQPADKPLLLPCGHVISEVALSRTVQASRGRGIKCPVCPQEITNTSTVRIYI